MCSLFCIELSVTGIRCIFYSALFMCVRYLYSGSWRVFFPPYAIYVNTFCVTLLLLCNLAFCFDIVGQVHYWVLLYSKCDSSTGAFIFALVCV